MADNPEFQNQRYTGTAANAAELSHKLTFTKDAPMFGLGWPEVLLILGVVVLIFGPKKIPEVGSALGKTLRGFKEEIETPQTSDYEEQDRS